MAELLVLVVDPMLVELEELDELTVLADEVEDDDELLEVLDALELVEVDVVVVEESLPVAYSSVMLVTFTRRYFTVALV